MNPTILGVIGPAFLNQDPTIDDLILYIMLYRILLYHIL